MNTIQVQLGERSYPIHVKSGLLKDVPDLLTETNHGQKWIIITQYGLMELFGFELMSNLKEQNFNTDYITLSVGEAPKSIDNGQVDLTYTGARWSGPIAFQEAGLSPSDIDYASIYDSFTITVLETIEDLGFCEKGQGGAFVSDGNLISGQGALPFNTDGGGLCNNHPMNRGGLTKVLEAVRQLREEAHPAVQVKNCQVALAHGTGGSIGTRMASSTVILGRADS